MERDSQVLEIGIEHEGAQHRATYFVEGNTIFANIDGKVIMTPRGAGSAQDTVKSLLSGQVLQQARKRRQASSWSGAER